MNKAVFEWIHTTHPNIVYRDLFAAAAKSLQSCPTLCDPRRQPTRLPLPWDSPGKNTGVGCHFLLQCMKVKSESEVTQSCPTLSDPMDCSLPGSSVHGIFQARVLKWGAIAFSERSVYMYIFAWWNLMKCILPCVNNGDLWAGRTFFRMLLIYVVGL